ncbi:hypothetical protein ACO1O0_003379 [Amphichorda felina]
MRPRPSHSFLLCAISLAKAAVVDQGHRSRRDGLLNEVKQLFRGGNQGRETVTETIRQTITVNGADALNSLNATTTETVTISVHLTNGVIEEDDEGGEVNAESFEGEQYQNHHYPSNRTGKHRDGGIAGRNGRGNGDTIMPRRLKPVPNEDGNGVGVTTVPIAESALPQTTLARDPLATLSIRTTLAPSALPPTPTKIAGEPAEPEEDEPEGSPGADEGDSSESDSDSDSESDSDDEDEGDENNEEEDSEDDEEDEEDEGDDDDEEEEEEDGDEDAPDPSAPADPVLSETSDPAGATAAPVLLPSIDLSRFSLNSRLNLGNLIPRTEVERAQSTDGP